MGVFSGEAQYISGWLTWSGWVDIGFYAAQCGGVKNDIRRMSIITAQKRKGGKTMKYSKPVIVAQNEAQGTFAAGCPAKGSGGALCKMCDRTQ